MERVETTKLNLLNVNNCAQIINFTVNTKNNVIVVFQ